MRYQRGIELRRSRPIDQRKVGIIATAPCSSVTTAMIAAAVAPNTTSGTEPS